MAILDLLWDINVSDNTKYLIIICLLVGLFIFCAFSGKKKGKMTECQKKYKKCLRYNKKNKAKRFCYPCLEDGSAPDFFYNRNGEWVSYN